MELEKFLYMYKAHVNRVVDGDTIDVTIDHGMRVYSEQRVRILGVDTPER
ncbi:endonuclease [Staphylococcus phage 110]|uniref:Endonuclease n=1 Tax=Staphylococcus phage 110 TaxID=3038194 RepID=A0AAX3Y3V3_9CAUD|nr:nuclease [Staphylococcus phage 110]